MTTTIIRLKKICRNYSREVLETSIRAILLLISTVVLSLIVLYFYNILWHIFGMTYSGKKFIMLHPVAMNMVSKIMSSDLFEVSIDTTFSSFTICLIISAICQVSHITRYFYLPQSIIVKILFWGMPITAVVSMYINDEIKFAHWSYTIPLTIVPTLCVFTYCFSFSEALLPELGAVIVKIFHGLKDFFSLAPHRQ